MIESLSGSALLVVDVQKDFCTGGNLAVQEGEQIVSVINRLMPLFPKVFASQDWHPSDHVSFASNHPGRSPFESIEIEVGGGKQEQILWPDHCVAGTSGADFHPDLDLNRIDVIVRKGTRRELDSYSAFFENDRRTPTGLEYIVKGLEYGSVFLTGLATDVCVFYSAMDAVHLGFTTYLVEDGTRGIDTPPGSLWKRLEEMREAGVKIIHSKELLS